VTAPTEDPLADFGPNEWLVYEIYQQYLQDPESVDPAWLTYFRNNRPPVAGGPGRTNGNGTPRPAPAESHPGPPPESAPAQSAPAQSAPAQNAPAQSGPAQSSPAQNAPAQNAPAQAAVAPTPPPPSPTPAAGSRPTTGGQTDPDTVRQLRGPAARVASNMQASLTVPTATSVRSMPAKLLIDNRVVINNHLRRGPGGKVSFTHLIGFALVQALADFPGLNRAFVSSADGKPAVSSPERVNLGVAIDLAKANGERQLLVPNIKDCAKFDFAEFWAAYEQLIRRARAGELGADDFAGTTISITNPGTIGTVHSVPRLLPGQGAIIGVGALESPAEYQGASLDTLARLAVSKVLTLTSTYDHRIIQGAESGDFLRRMHALLLGADGFYDAIFRSLRVPYEPVRWVTDLPAGYEEEVGKPARVIELIHAYRVRGHLMADTNPLEFELRRHADLDVVNHGLTLWDLDRSFPTGGFGGAAVMHLRDVLGVLRDSYCRTVGIEYMHIQDPEQRRWLQDRVERAHIKPARAEQLHILRRLGEAEAFETFLHTKYIGQKRFSLEGAETTIPLLDAVLDAAAHDAIDEVTIGMSHRGRLNVLANIVGKSYAEIFREFEGNLDPTSTHGSGDVKYHLGAEGSFTASDGAAVQVSLSSNPSHLEAVDPVVEGIARAKQDMINRGPDGFTVLPILLHGDAAFAGQGVVAETLNLSQLRGYRTGGTVHVVINNQVGFTTSPLAGRSSVYATDVARMIQAPIFHVNGDDPEAAVRVARLAFQFRQAFRKDVVVDLICYRRRGHNEADDPSLTQPLMYDLIDAQRSVRRLYMEALAGRGDITREEAELALQHYQGQLERAFAETRDAPAASAERAPEMPPVRAEEEVGTAVERSTLDLIAAGQLQLPPGFNAHPRLETVLRRRSRMLEEDAVDWGMGETFALGSLLLEGRPVRLAGQDSRRGTFGQRHAVVVDRRTGAEYTPLAHLSADQGSFYVYDSLLSEYAAMGFEYGYSVARPEALVCWEAQFGDFANGAQTVIDEFVVSGEAKWGQASALTLLLPHGYEGQGPNHSSARIERFLALCAEGNLTVAVPSTPANYFHLLRRQALAARRRPLVVFTPKSLLRLRAAVSASSEFTSGSWRPVIDDAHAGEQVRRVLLCSGKLFYDLQRAREQAPDVALVRLEQLYPLPEAKIRAVLGRYPGAELFWAQEEPANMGGWPYIALHLPRVLDGRELGYRGRPESAAPAAGSLLAHDAEQEQVIAQALHD
jgi:2-oxoglutarate decarboxylase